MTKEEFYLLNYYYKKSKDENYSSILFTKDFCDKEETKYKLFDLGYIDSVNKSGKITEKGLEILQPYKVDNAIIMAAGASVRCIPLSLEKPKGLFEIRGEKLIERLIKQLIESGIEDITIVLGYKKEMFFYLKDKFGVKFIFNDLYNRKNNIETLYKARDELKNTYICACDNYFVKNPFESYEYDSFYAGINIDKRLNEIYVECDKNGKIIDLNKGNDGGTILRGHSFWKREFCKKFIDIVEKDKGIGIYDDQFWEWLYKDNIENLPPMYLKKYEKNSIYEFDYFEELREFDKEYQIDAKCKVLNNIKAVFKCNEIDIVNFRNIEEGMTNKSFLFNIDGIDYIYRHPGDGTESIINRKNEKISLEFAKKYKFDPTYVYMNPEEGWKISIYIPEFREPNYDSWEDSCKIIKKMQKLHSEKIEVDYGMKPFEDSLEMEKILIKKDKHSFDEFVNLKTKIKKIYDMTKNDGVKKCFCHGDTYKPNWMILPDDEVVLIDWEYSGYSDPGIDVGYYIVDAKYDFEQAKKFIRKYLGKEYTEKTEFHFMGYVAIIAYYWFVWALYREACGAVMGEALFDWYQAAVKYSNYLIQEDIK